MRVEGVIPRRFPLRGADNHRASRMIDRSAQTGTGVDMPSTAILDIDGTLVDTNFLHALAWQRALRAHGHEVPAWHIHRAIGMGGDQLVPHLIGDDANARDGDAIRDTEQDAYQQLIGEARPLPGAKELLVALRDRGITVVLASSAKADELEHYLDLLDAREVADAWTSAADVAQTKPAPDLVEVALEKAGDRDAVMLGDTVWDMQAARRAGIPAAAVRTGGFPDDELQEAGAVALYDDASALLTVLDDSPFGRQTPATA